MKIKIKNKKLNKLLADAFPNTSVKIPRDPLLIRQIKRLEKKTNGRIQLEQRVNFNSFPTQKNKKRFYEEWEL